MTRAESEPGERAVHPGDAHVLAEIASQPDCWTQALQASGEAAKVLPGRGERVAITGCGTSWHIATAIALAREAAGHGETDAFPASELPVRAYDAVLAISRSGTTTEVLEALKNVPGPVRKIGITADGATPIRDVTDQLLVLNYADEQSVVQTRFATTPHAISSVNGTTRCWFSAATITVTGCVAMSVVRISGNKNCAQPRRNTMMAAAAMPGMATGIITRHRAPIGEAPSTNAASSSSAGMLLK
jgi:D-arabinose 5-phosphate isomerase GutQ